jgi:VCBS repeat-containing protein
VGPSEVTVDEAHLATGTHAGEDATFRDGSLIFEAKDGVASVAINGTTVYKDGALIVDTFTQDFGELKITAIDFNPADGTGTLHYTYSLTGATNSHEQGQDRNSLYCDFKVKVTDSDGDFAENYLTVHIKDDVPEIVPVGSELRYTYGADTPAENELSQLPSISFLGKAYANNSTNIDMQYWEGQGIELGVCRVPDGAIGSVNDLDEANSDEKLVYRKDWKQITNYKGEQQDHYDGLSVSGTHARHANEISHDVSQQMSQGVVVNLGDKIAYGFNIELGSFYMPETDMSGSDQGCERAQLLFFDASGKCIDCVVIESRSMDGIARVSCGTGVNAEGKVVPLIEGATEITDASSGFTEHAYINGFSTVVISAVGYDIEGSAGKKGEDSDFLIRSMDFPTKFSGKPEVHVDGKVELKEGADGIAAGNGAGAPIQFAADTFTAMVDGEAVLVTVTPFEGGNSVQATYPTGSGTGTLFYGSVDTKGNFALDLYKQFSVADNTGTGKGDLSYGLKFTSAADGDGDPVPATSVPVRTMAFNVDIVSDNGDKVQQNGEEAIVRVTVQTDGLEQGTELHLHAEGGELGARDYTLTWDGTDFVSETEGFRLENKGGGVFEWKEHVSTAAGLQVTGTLETGGARHVSGDTTRFSLDTVEEIVRNTVLSSDNSATIRELGVHANSNYIWNQTGSEDGTVTGSFTQDGFTNAGNALQFVLSPVNRTAGGVDYTAAEYSYSTPDADGWVTIDYLGGIRNVLVGQGDGSRAELPEHAFSIVYNQHSGEYRLHIDNDLPFSELRGSDGNWDAASANIRFTLAVKGENGVTLAEKTFDFQLKAANDVPELHLVNADGQIADDDVVSGNAGYVGVRDDTGDTATYRVFTEETSNNGTMKAAWKLSYTPEQLVYSEANLDMWMADYAAAVGEAGTASADKNYTFLKTPPTNNLGTTSKGKHGSLTVDSGGRFEYTLNDNAFREGGKVVEDTFHILVTDSKGSFDIKDVTFLAVFGTDGVVHYLNGSPEFIDKIPVDEISRWIGADAYHSAVVGTEADEGLFGDDNDNTLDGGAGNDLLSGGDGNDALDGGAGNDLLFGGAGTDAVKGGDGIDRLFGDAGNDVLEGGSGNDELHGGTGADILYGDESLAPGDAEGTLPGGDDLLYGGEGDDLLFGGAGNDYLDGGAGADKLYGGAGNDIIAFDGDDAVINGGSGVDFLVGEGSVEALLQGHDGMDITDVEVAIDTTMSLTSMDDIAEKLGIIVENGRVSVDNDAGWTQGPDQQAANGDEFVTFTHTDVETGTEDATLTVAKAVLETSNG